MTARFLSLKRPAKILYLVPTLATGGTEQQLGQLVRGLDRSRFQPLVVTIYGPAVVPVEIEVPDCDQVSLAKPLGKPGNLIAIERLMRLIRRERPDILQSFLRPADLYLRLAGRLVGHPRVVTSLRTRIQGFWSPTWQWTERMLWRSSTLIVSNSFAVAKEAQDHLGIPETHLRVIPNGVDLERFHPGRSRAEARNGLGPDRWDFLVGMVARYSPVKDHETLLRALRMIREAGDWPLKGGVLFVGGTTYQEARDRVEEQIREWALERICQVRGVTSDIVEVYQALDWLVLPSRFEGFPNTVLEAMACERPVIVSSAANGEQIVEEDKTGFVFPTGNPEALASCLRKALALSEPDWRVMGRAARSQAERRFSSSLMVDRYEALYEDLLGKGKNSPCM